MKIKRGQITPEHKKKLDQGHEKLKQKVSGQEQTINKKIADGKFADMFKKAEEKIENYIRKGKF